MFNLQSKFEVSMITCNKEMKDNVKCFQPPFGGFRGNAQSSFMARCKAHFPFLLAIIELFR